MKSLWPRLEMSKVIYEVKLGKRAFWEWCSYFWDKWTHPNQRIVCVGEGREKFGSVFLAEMGTTNGDITGQSRPVNSCDIRPCRPFRIITGSEDNSVAYYEGPPFKFKGTKTVWLIGVSILIKVFFFWLLVKNVVFRHFLNLANQLRPRTARIKFMIAELEFKYS